LESEELPRAEKSALPAIGSRIAVPHSTKGILRLEFVFLLAIFMLSIILRMFWIKTVVVRDEGAVGYVTMLWLRGYLPYGGPMVAWNPPLAYLIYLPSLQLFGNEIVPIRMINNVIFWISIVVLYLVAKDWYGKSVALVSAFFYGVFMNVPIFETHLAFPDSMSVPFMVFSICFCSIYLRKGQRSALFVSGLLMSAASLIVQYQAIGSLLLLVMLVYRYVGSKEYLKTRAQIARKLSTDISILVSGIISPFLLAFAYFYVHGVAEGLMQVFSFARYSNYFSYGDVPSSLMFLILFEALPLWLFSFSGFIISLLTNRKYSVILIAWALLSLPIAIGPPHFGRHFSQLIPVASILSGLGVVSVLSPLSKNLRKLRQDASGIFLITVLALSFVPSVYFQMIQYPNTNFTLWNETFYYSFSNNWNQQQEIVDFIKSNAPTKSILIHGWEAELYWLSGHEAPGLRWTSSYISTRPDISNKSYEEILNQVQEGDFEFVILMSGFQPDEIMHIVPSKYFLVKSIGLYQIYSKYNAEGYSIGYSFIENFGQAYRRYSFENGTEGDMTDLNESIYLPFVQEITINNESRATISQPAIAPLDLHIVDSNLIYNNIPVSAGSKLSFGVAMNPDSWTKDTDGVLFKILVEDKAGTNEIFSKYVSPHENTEDRRWQDFQVDLNEFAGEKVSFYFVIDPGPNLNNAYDWAVWSNPLLLNSH
jgi:hypothetical protein